MSTEIFIDTFFLNRRQSSVNFTKLATNTIGMTKRIIITSGIMGSIAVVLHLINTLVLSGHINPENLEVFQNGVIVLFVQAVAVLAISFLKKNVTKSNLNAVYLLFLTGTIFYALPLLVNGLHDLSKTYFPGGNTFIILGAILLFMGWIILIIAGANYKHRSYKR